MTRVVAVVVVLLAGVAAAPAVAATQAPGAPGAVHTWAPADKHGFGTARQAAERRAAFTLRAASLTEVYFPDLSTPSFRGLQFAVTDGARLRRPRDRRRRPAPHRAGGARRDARASRRSPARSRSAR